MGLEGLVSKHRDRPYRAGSSPHWVKVKNRKHPAMERVMDFPSHDQYCRSRSLSAGLRTPVDDLPLIPNLNSEIVDPLAGFQLLEQPARPLATTGPSF